MTNNTHANQAMPVDLDSLEALLAQRQEHNAAGELKQLSWVEHDIANAASALIAELRALQAANRWRPIAEGLPEDNLNVLVWDGERVSKSFQRGGWWFSDGLYLSRKITHWRPLPDPPEAP